LEDGMTGNSNENEELVLPPPEDTPEEDAKENRRKAVRELIIIGLVLFFIFVVFLPQFIDYGQVLDSLSQLTIGQVVLLSVMGIVYTWFSAGVYNVLIPGLGWWNGWKAWAASNSIAFVAPPGADLAIRFGMYRTAGISGEAAGAGIVLSWFFTTGYKLIVPIIAIAWIVIAEGINDELVIAITAIGLAAVVGGVGLTFLILYRENVALKVGQMGQRWYNGMAGGKWKFPEAEGLGVKLVDFRAQAIGTVQSRWFPAVVVTLSAQAVFFVMLVISMRLMGVTAEQASVSIIFDAYAVGLLLSMIPIFPGGLGVVELAYVGVIVGTSGNSELAAAVTAGAFVHRIFSWLVPIIVGLIPLAAWRRDMVKSQDATIVMTEGGGGDRGEA
jgi:uncharacterized protein (TIRG00374 family)